MRSYRPRTDPRRKKFVDLIGLVHLEIDNAVAGWRVENQGASRAELARRLGLNKSVLTRRLKGTSNMTLKTIADLAWVLGRNIEFAMPKPADGNNHAVPEPQTTVTRVSESATDLSERTGVIERVCV